MESLRNQKSEEEAVFEESGHEYNNRPDVKKSVSISVNLEEDLTLHAKESTVLRKSTVWFVVNIFIKQYLCLTKTPLPIQCCISMWYLPFMWTIS